MRTDARTDPRAARPAGKGGAPVTRPAARPEPVPPAGNGRRCEPKPNGLQARPTDQKGRVVRPCRAQTRDRKGPTRAN
jgi:hypothetical protein